MRFLVWMLVCSLLLWGQAFAENPISPRVNPILKKNGHLEFNLKGEFAFGTKKVEGRLQQTLSQRKATALNWIVFPNQAFKLGSVVQLYQRKPYSADVDTQFITELDKVKKVA